MLRRASSYHAKHLAFQSVPAEVDTDESFRIKNVSRSKMLRIFVLLLSTLTLTLTLAKTMNGSSAFGEKTLYNSESLINNPRTGFHVVVSHCDSSINWITKEISDIPSSKYKLKSITIITKCGVPIPISDIPFKDDVLIAVIETLNVGRCDHSYAYWITKILHDGNTTSMFAELFERKEKVIFGSSELPLHKISQSVKYDDLVLFIKDSKNDYRYRMEKTLSIQQMFNGFIDNVSIHSISAHKESIVPDNLTYTIPPRMGFACSSTTNSVPKGVKRPYICTDWAHRSDLWTFQMVSYTRRKKYNIATPESNMAKTVEFVSGQRPMGSWIHHLSTHNKTNFQETSRKGAYKNEARPVEKDLMVFSKDFMRYAIDETLRQGGYFYNISRGLAVDMFKNYRKKDLVPACFGGFFATKWGQLASDDAPITPYGWAVITNALSRGDNIEEGHYMERLWADVLTWSLYSATRLDAISSKGVKKSFAVLDDAQQQDLINRKYDCKINYRKVLLLDGLYDSQFLNNTHHNK